MTKRHKSLTRQRLDFLGEEGYRPRCDDDPGDDDSPKVVTFKSEGQTFLLFVYEDDPDYFNVGFSFDLGEGEQDRAALTAPAAAVNDEVKGVKCTLGRDDNSVRFQVESFLGGAKPTSELLTRCLSALRHAATEFFEKRVPPDHLDA
jgi:hypothetical protein